MTWDRGTIGRRAVRAAMLAGLLVLGAAGTARAQIAVRGGKVYTMTGPPIEDGVVVIRDGKVAAVGRAADVRVPDDFRLLEAAFVVPGLIDTHSVVGLAGALNYRHDQEQLDGSEPIQPELRALDAYNARETLVDWVRGFGVTTFHTGHAPGALVSGQTMIVKTRGETIDEAVLVPRAAVAVTLGEDARRGEKESPGTRGKMAAMLRQTLVGAREYAERRRLEDAEKVPPRDLRLEVLGEVLRGELPLLVTAHRAQDVATALRIAEEFGVRIILDGGAEAYLVADRLASANVPVILHPPMARYRGDLENASFESAAKLKELGLRVALQSGYESYVPKTRVVLFEAAIAAAYGMAFEDALATITVDAARILGIDDRVGSIAVGKDGDLALYDGDPFEYTTHCTATIIEGEVVSEGERQRETREREL